jgi:hypothetical protein
MPVPSIITGRELEVTIVIWIARIMNLIRLKHKLLNQISYDDKYCYFLVQSHMISVSMACEIACCVNFNGIDKLNRCLNTSIYKM